MTKRDAQRTGGGVADKLHVSQASLIRVFPRRTPLTPDDDLAFVGGPPLFPVPARRAHVSCLFTWDRREAGRLAEEWAAQGYKVELGGPAFGGESSEFEPGLYVKNGATITSRGCIRHCPFCFVPEREGPLRTLEIKPGWDILDNNLLACPRKHVEAVLAMLNEQPRAARFTGGIDARLCRPWFAARLAAMRLDILYMAYDMPETWSAVERTIGLMRGAGIGQRKVGCYVLVGYEGDTLADAERRLSMVLECGGMPFAMYYRGADWTGKPPSGWARLVRSWSRPAAIFAKEINDAQRDDLLNLSGKKL